MAVFEKSYSEDINIDDTVPLTCVITNFRTVDAHTEYIIKVHRGFNEEHNWVVIKRYREFVALHKELHAASYNINLPPKRYIGNLNRQFILERQALLQKYLNDILGNIFLSSFVAVRKFFDPDNYSSSFTASALQNASMALRDKPDFYLVKSLPDIGWRYRKTNCLLRKRNDAAENEYVMSWLEYGPDKCLDFREMRSALKVLLQLQNPYIVPIIAGSCYNAGALIIHSNCCKGSLRDIIYNKHPYETFLNKYQFNKEKLVLQLDQVVMISIQVLRALQFLHDNKIPYGNLHSGNVFIEDGVAKISDIENGILGVPSLYRPYLIHSRRIHTLEDVDVYCFGHLLYEMTFGEYLSDFVCYEIPSYCNNIIKPILQLILCDASKEKLPTVSTLLNHSSFRLSSSRGYNYDKRLQHCKMSSQSRNYMERVKCTTEKRLHEDQQKLKMYKRLTHLQELVDAEEDENFNNNNSNNRRKKCKVKKSTSQMSIGTASIADSVSSVGTPTSQSTDAQTPSSFSSKDDSKTYDQIMSSDSVSSSMAQSPLKEDRGQSEFLQSILNFNKTNLRKVTIANGV